MSRFFITGTDTNVGKTITAAVMLLAERGHYWKPINSGESDTDIVQHLTGLPHSHFHATQYALQASLSPDQAAALENVHINIEMCRLPSTDKMIVEGAGGVYTPLNENQNMLNLMQQLALPVIVVARGTLGTINHTLLTIETLRNRHLNVHGIVLNGDLNPANQQAIEKWSGLKTLFHIPRFETLSSALLQHWVQENLTKIQEGFV